MVRDEYVVPGRSFNISVIILLIIYSGVVEKLHEVICNASNFLSQATKAMNHKDGIKGANNNSFTFTPTDCIMFSITKSIYQSSSINYPLIITIMS